MDFPFKVIIKGKGVDTLQKQNYIAAGGEGTVCQKGGTAYKVYHDPKKMIAVAKINELQCLSSLKNVLGPQDILLDAKSNTPIGFTMSYIAKTEFLCRIFSKNFKSDNNISPDMIVEMVKIMQKTLLDIHKNKILVVDLNEMNFLTSEKFDQVYFIDCDSYQTPHFKATALMESVRDRLGKPGDFNEGTDWFSFAIVTFQLYMGYHPYRKGKHPDFAPKDWSERMDKQVSVFHKDVQLDDVWKTWDLIPKPHLEWYKRVFNNKERSIPPLPDGVVTVAKVQPLMIGGTGKFDVSLVQEYKEKILVVYHLGGIRYVITTAAVYNGLLPIYTFPKRTPRMSLGCVLGSDPVVALLEGSEMIFKDLNSTEVARIACDAAMSYEGRIYTVHNGKMTENSFQIFGKKTIRMSKEVANIFPATKLYPGGAIQDILRTCWMAIPYKMGFCSNCRVKELDGHRVIDAKYDNGICITVSELDGKYFRTVLCFNASADQYTFRQEDTGTDISVNFTVLKNGVCIHIPNDDKVEVFRDNTKVMTVDDPPFSSDMRLLNDTTGVFFINQTKLYSVKLK